MAYPYYPNYMQGNNYMYQQQAPVQQNQGIIWVQGEAGAKSYLVGAGQSVLLMDSESSSFFIKSTDASGMPLPLRVFDYTERTNSQPSVPVQAANAHEFNPKEYITRDEFNQWTTNFKASLKAARREVEDAE